MNKVKLADICKILNGYAFKSANYISKGIRIIRITNVQNGYIEDNSPAFYPIERKSEIENYLLKKDDLLLSLTGNVGRVALLPEEMLPAALNQRVACLRLNDEKVCDKKFLYYCLNNNSFERKCICSSKGIAQKNLSTEWLKSYKIELPEINIQKKIVDTLDKLNKLIFYRNTQLRLLDDLVKSRFTELCGDPISNPFNWKKKKISEVCTKIGSGATPKGGKASYISEGISLIRSMNVHNGYFKYDELAHISENQAKELQNVCIEKNDVLLNITGASVARSCIVPNNILPARVNQHVSILRANLKILEPIFLNLVLINDNYQHYLLSISESNGATRQALTKQQIENLVIPIPPLECQSRMACYFKRINKSK